MSIVLSVATATKGFTSVLEIAPGVAFHAACALGGVYLTAVSKRMKARPAEAVQAG